MGLTPQEALDLFNSDDLLGIGMAANEVRRQKTDPRIATYQIDRNINYTNFCTEYCFTVLWAPRTAISCRLKPSTKRFRK
jgi:2-iminoacetate synthase ThiH